jgi:hypothetical protein
MVAFKKSPWIGIVFPLVYFMQWGKIANNSPRCHLNQPLKMKANEIYGLLGGETA